MKQTEKLTTEKILGYEPKIKKPQFNEQCKETII